MTKLQALGILGGTFDPIHFGHLRSSLEIMTALKFDEMRLVPCHFPPHRDMPAASTKDRINMIKLAIQNSPLSLDEQELHRTGPSYSIDTLIDLRRAHPEASLCMTVGTDAFLGLNSWHQWEKLIKFTNIVVMHREGWSMPDTGIIADFYQEHALKADNHITAFSCGQITVQSISNLDISGSKIRRMIANHQSPRFLLPEKVLEYIETHQLYSHNDSHSETKEEVPRK